MNARKAFRSVVGLVFAGTLALAVPAGHAADAQTVIRTRLNADILSNNPGVRRDENSDGVVMHVVEGLVALRENGAVGPMLADHWTVSPDGKTYRFTLRPDVTFHDGRTMTSADVVWSLTRYLDPATHWRCLADLSKDGIAAVDRITAIGQLEVEIGLDRPAPLFLATLARPDCGGTGILSPASVDAAGRWIAPIGTGPYRFGAWKHNQFVELDRFASYASRAGPPDGYGGGKSALVDKVRFLVIPDASAARAALQRGELDILDGLEPTELPSLRGKPGITISSARGDDLYALLLQTRDPLLRDVRLRRAIALSIDAARLTTAVTEGLGDPHNGPIPGASPYSGPVESALAETDIQKARLLARESGYKGQPIKLGVNLRYAQTFNAGVLVQAMAAQAGINFEIETLDWAAELARYAAGDYQALSFPYSARMDPSFILSAMIGDKAKDPRKVWDTPEAQQLLQDSLAEPSPERRQEIFDAVTRAFEADVPAVALFSAAHVTALRTNVTGFRGWAAGLPRFWNVRLR